MKTMKRLRGAGSGLISRTFWLVLFTIGMQWPAMAQDDTGISLKWDKEFGCQVANSDDPGHIKYEELIASGNCLKVCQNSTVTYSLYSTDQTTWTTAVWTVSGGTAVVSPDTFSCTITWGTAGDGSVSAIIGTFTGQQSIPTLCTSVMPAPIAVFGINSNDPATDLTVCVDTELNFTNLSTAPGGTEIVSYLWDFGDGVSSSLPDPVHAYTAAGTYTVTMRAINACHCESIYSSEVKVTGDPVSIRCAGVVCEGDRVTYGLATRLRCLINVGHWSSTGGSVPIVPEDPPLDALSYEVIWDNIPDTGFGEVRFSSTDCITDCPSVTSVRIPVIKEHINIQGETSACRNQQYRYTLPQWPSTDFQWSMTTETGAVLIQTDQRNEVIIETAGTGKIFLNATYQNTLLNCGGVAYTLEINVKKPLTIFGDRVVCPGLHNYQIENGAMAFWTVTNPDGTTHLTTGTSFLTPPFTAGYLFDMPGTYTILATTFTNCNTAAIKVQVKALPDTPNILDFHGKRVVCPGVPETFTFENTVPGTILGWKVANGLNSAGAPVPGGSFNGSNYGETVTINLNPNLTGLYHIQVWREYASNPHCQSELLDITISRPPSNLHIVSDNGFPEPLTVCPSSYSNFTVYRIGESTPYADGEVYTWSLEDPTAGSIITNGTPSAKILWNQTDVELNTNVLLNIRKCGPMPQFSFPVSIQQTPALEITVPETICESRSFEPQVVYPPDYTPSPGQTVEWFVDGESRGMVTNIQVANSSTMPATHLLKAVVHHINGCDYDVSVERTITVHGALQFDLLPALDQYLCSPFTFPLSLNPTPGSGATIQWYKDNIEIPGATAATYNATAWGTYYANISIDGCSMRTQGTELRPGCGPGGPGSPPCEIAGGPPTTMTVGYTLDGCGHISATANLVPAPANPTWTLPADCYQCSAVQDNATATAVGYTLSKPGLYRLNYTGLYPAVGGGECAVTASTLVEIPFIAKVSAAIECNAAGTGYTVTLRDLSPTYNTTITHRVFYIDGTPYAQAGATKTVVYSLPGTHTYKLKVYDDNPAHLSCTTAEYSFVVPELPNPAFTYTSETCSSGCGEVCSNKTIKMHLAQPPVAGQTYLWDFGDGTNNTQPEPEKTYGDPDDSFIIYPITLTVTNENGCVVSSTKPVTVMKNRLSGTIGLLDAISCEDTAIQLSYNNLGVSVPTSFTFMNGTQEVGTNSTGVWNLNNNISGAYWIKVKDSYGCTFQTDPNNAAFVMVPDVQITAPNRVCAGQSYTLSAYAGAGAEYNWTVDGEETGYSAAYAELGQLADENLIGSFVTYTLKIRVPKGPAGSGYCYSDVVTKLVYVDGPPPAPVVSIVPSDPALCNPYRVVLYAYNPDGTPGTFNWSDGQSSDGSFESTVTVTAGGPYQVRFTNEAGCSATAQIEVPKDPELYLWLFPTGCYNLCSEIKRFVLAPLPAFAHWEWQQDDFITDQGDGSILPDLDFHGDGTYRQLLQNQGCAVTSKDLNLEYHCDPCEFLSFDNLDIASIEEGFCHYSIHLLIYNGTSSNLQVRLTAAFGHGIVSPSVLTVAPGDNDVTVSLIPTNGFAGGPLMLYMELVGHRNHCTIPLQLVFPPLCPSEVEPSRPAATGTAATAPALSMVPNPAQAATVVRFDYAVPEAAGLELALYDLTGRLLDRFAPGTTKGTWQLDTARFAAGTYIVTMKQHGKVIEQKNLVLE